LFGVALILVVAAGVGVYFWQDRVERQASLLKGLSQTAELPPTPPPQSQSEPQPDSHPQAQPPAQTQAQPQPPPSPPIAQALPEVIYPLPQDEAMPGLAAKPVPPLDESDGVMHESLAELLSKKRFVELFTPKDFVYRVVTTVDNLPRKNVATRLLPLRVPAGQFVTKGGGEVVSLSPANYARYQTYVNIARNANAKQLVATYVHFYPLFQEAYQELGYPQKQFNDRLVEVIDNLLETPDVGVPVKLIRPKVMYEFDDPELEDLSAGQKLLVRMGPENAAVLKAKLREIRRELVAEAQAATKR
jgi:Protein of unknown function (DUF3014)